MDLRGKRMDSKILLKEEQNGVATLTLNRPEKMNAINFDLLYDLRNQIEKLKLKSDIRVIIITGAGGKVF